MGIWHVTDRPNPKVPTVKLSPSTTPSTSVIFEKNRSGEKLVQKLCVANGCTYNARGVISIIYATTVIVLLD